MAITTLQQLGLVFSAIQRSSECVVYATLDFQETAFAANYWVTLPGTRDLPPAVTWELHLTEFIFHRRGGGGS